MDILTMDKSDLVQLKSEDVTETFNTVEVVHIAKELDAFWSYDYEAARNGRPGMHALLKSGLHSDGFFVSRIMLKFQNIRRIMATQMAMRILQHMDRPDEVGGIPDGATELGEDLATILGSKNAKLSKVEGKIELDSWIKPGRTLLLCEDFCTQGTGYREAVIDIHYKCPKARLIFYAPVIINRGGLKYIKVDGIGLFMILPIANYLVNNWPESKCPLCKKFGSKAIKPKETDENWKLLNASQLQ